MPNSSHYEFVVFGASGGANLKFVDWVGRPATALAPFKDSNYRDVDGAAYKMEINRDYHLMRPDNADRGPLVHELLQSWFTGTQVGASP